MENHQRHRSYRTAKDRSNKDSSFNERESRSRRGPKRVTLFSFVRVAGTRDRDKESRARILFNYENRMESGILFPVSGLFAGDARARKFESTTYEKSASEQRTTKYPVYVLVACLLVKDIPRGIAPR